MAIDTVRTLEEIRLFDTESGELLGTAILDTGSGYNSQNAMPVFFGIPGSRLVDVEITTMTPQGRAQTRITGIDAADYADRWMRVKLE